MYYAGVPVPTNECRKYVGLGQVVLEARQQSGLVPTAVGVGTCVKPRQGRLVARP